MISQRSRYSELDPIARCLLRFLRDHGGDATLHALPLDEGSVNGQRIQEEGDVWFLGQWTLHGTPPRYKATWSTDTAPDGTILLTVDIAKTDHEYEVTGWDIKHILF